MIKCVRALNGGVKEWKTLIFMYQQTSVLGKIVLDELPAVLGSIWQKCLTCLWWGVVSKRNAVPTNY